MAFRTDNNMLNILAAIVASISVFCSLMILFLIVDMGRYTGFIWLVATLTISEMIYDISFFFELFDMNDAALLVYYFLQIFGGLMATFMTNAIAMIVANIAYSLRSYDIKKNYGIIVSVIFVISFTIATAFVVTYKVEVVFVYASLRILSILINLVLCTYLAIRYAPLPPWP